ncbi:MAG: class I SAM-dependent methyltransferase [Candidatus Muiribacteriota bacterium]
MKKFNFGKNWKNFLKTVDEKRITEAENSLKKMLKMGNLSGKRFLDAGSGSGLFSLAAKRLGAEVYSFDYDNDSVECTKYLRKNFFQNNEKWHVERGDILDTDYINKIGSFDIVYSWGVLHHTGNLEKALENIIIPLKSGGTLFISLYNYQNYMSALNTFMKKKYVYGGKLTKIFIAGFFIFFKVLKGFLKDIFFLKNPLLRYKNKKNERGMSVFYDWIDWIGGYPFEPSRPDDIINLFIDKNFTLINVKTMGGGHGCNEFVFVKK